MTWFPWEFRLASGRTTILLPRNYSPRRIREEIRRYGATHILWGSFAGSSGAAGFLSCFSQRPNSSG